MDKTLIKAAIEAKIKALQELQEEAKAGCKTVSLDQARVGRLTRMDAMQSQAMNQAAQRRRSLEFFRLKQALEQIEFGDYGYCEQCDNEIVEGRLLLDPAVRYCTQCAGQLEG